MESVWRPLINQTVETVPWSGLPSALVTAADGESVAPAFRPAGTVIAARQGAGS